MSESNRGRIEGTIGPHVCIVIVSYHSISDLYECIAALDNSTYRDFDVLICENGGANSYEALGNSLRSSLRHGQRIKFHLAPYNLGYAGGVNFCLSRADSADAYWILNPDTIPRPDALSALVRRLLLGDCDAVGHDIVFPDGKLASRAGRWSAWNARAISIDMGELTSAAHDVSSAERRSNYIVGASMLVSASFIQRVGVMREDYFLYCEEIEWCLRAQRLGLKLGYSPDAIVVHRHGTSTGGGGPLRTRPKLPVYLGERNRLLLTRDLFPWLLPSAALASFIRIIVKYGRASAWNQIGYGLSGWTDGLRNVRGHPTWTIDASPAAETLVSPKRSGQSIRLADDV